MYTNIRKYTLFLMTKFLLCLAHIFPLPPLPLIMMVIYHVNLFQILEVFYNLNCIKDFFFHLNYTPIVFALPTLLTCRKI